MSLRTKLILINVGLVFAVVCVISGYFIIRQGSDIRDLVSVQTEKLGTSLRKKGLVLTRNIALSSERALGMHDFLMLRELIDAAIKQDPEVVYGIILDNEGRALVHSEPQRAGTVLDDEASKFARAQTESTVQQTTYRGEPVLDFVSPIAREGEKWATVRLGISLAGLSQEIKSAETLGRGRIRQAILATVIAAVLLLVLGTLLSVTFSNAIGHSLTGLIAGANIIREGKLDHRIESGGIPELASLANAFNDMSKALTERNDELNENMAELRTALERVEEANRLKSEFLANISHELRTPLNTIVNVPELLLQEELRAFRAHCDGCGSDFDGQLDIGEPEPDEIPCPDCGRAMTFQVSHIPAPTIDHRPHLKRLHQSGRHLLNVVNDLLDFSKLEAGKMKLQRARVDLGEVFDDVQNTLTPLAAEKQINLSFPQLSGPVVLNADTVKLAQVLINLIGNAIKFTPEGGRIDVGVEDGALDGLECAIFTVRDTGVGIPPDQLDAIFESFRQVDGSHTRSHGGTGLGLAITRQLVELHGGRIWVTSELGKGSTFHFILPRDGGEPSETQTLTMGGGEPVVVVDDQRGQLELAAMILRRLGYQPVLTDQPERAAGIVEQVEPLFVILDIMMPGLSGLSVLKTLKGEAKTRAIPVFVTTAYHANKELVEQLGGIWTPKPWGIRSLSARLRQLRTAA